MSDRRNTSSVLKMRLSILFREAHDLELQLFELNELRYRVSQAELLARNRGVQVDQGQRRVAPQPVKAWPTSAVRWPSDRLSG
jgi:hypothetical protein